MLPGQQASRITVRKSCAWIWRRESMEVKLAVAEGFEPSKALALHAFEVC
jgi:hypothetical protein